MLRTGKQERGREGEGNFGIRRKTIREQQAVTMSNRGNKQKRWPNTTQQNAKQNNLKMKKKIKKFY